MKLDGKVEPIESLRGLAALCVCLFHSPIDSILADNGFIDRSYMMVDLFLVLSGFVIYLTYFDKIRTFNELTLFQTKRFWRLYPLHLVTLFAFLAIEIAKYAAQERLGVVGQHPAFEKNDGIAFVLNLFLSHAVFLNHLTFNDASWSISIEFYIYFIFGLAVLFGKRVFFPVITVIVLLSILYVLTDNVGFKDTSTGLGALARCMESFFLGCMICALVQRVKRGVPWLGTIGLVASVIAVTMFGGTPVEVALPFLFAATLFAVVTVPSSRLYSVLSAKPMVYLGTLSYGVYLWHGFVWWVMEQGLRFGADIETQTGANGDVGLVIPELPAIGLTLLGLVITLGMAHVTYWQVEDRFRRGWPKRHRPVTA